jgi:hypothetical protein
MSDMLQRPLQNSRGSEVGQLKIRTLFSRSAAVLGRRRRSEARLLNTPTLFRRNARVLAGKRRNQMFLGHEVGGSIKPGVSESASGTPGTRVSSDRAREAGGSR